MLSKINPRHLIVAHFKTLSNYQTGKIDRSEVCLFLGIPAVLSVIHINFFEIDADTIAMVVSAASIVAGLMLNLMVLVYTLIVNNKQNTKAYSNFDDFKKICRETLATIAYSVLLCVVLVISSFICLTTNQIFKISGWFLMVYSGVAVIFCLLIILKRSYLLIDFDLVEISNGQPPP